jgi:SulP family sulfate permease
MTSATQAAGARRQRSLQTYMPILQWLPAYDRAWLRGDVIAGLTVMALLVPEGMAYAELAGMPPQTAVLAGLLRLGRIAQFFSESVLTGFVSGLALVIMIKQAPKMLGLESGHGNFWERLLELITQLPATHLLTAAVGLSTLALMLFLERRYHRIPAALAGLVYGIGVVTIFGLDARGVHIVGDIPGGLAPPALPDVSVADLGLLLAGALGITLVMFAEAIGPARSFAGKHNYRINADQELIGLGAANFGAGLFQGFPIGASLSKSAANDNAHASSQMSGLIAAGLTALVALFLTPLFRNLPEAALGAIVIVAVAGMFKLERLKWLYRVRRQDFWFALVALLGVLTFEEVLFGLLVAVVVSLLALVARTSRPDVSVHGRAPGHVYFNDVSRHPESLQIPGLLIVRPNEAVFFANASALRDVLVSLTAQQAEPVQTLILDLEMSNELDAPGTEMLHALYEDLAAQGIELNLARVRPPVMETLEQSGVMAQIGREHIHVRALNAVLECLQKRGEAAATVLDLMHDETRRMREVALAAAAHAAEPEAQELATFAEQLATMSAAIETDQSASAYIRPSGAQ